MKLFYLKAAIVAASLLATLQACTKDDAPVDPRGPQVYDTALTEQKLIGTWEAVSYTGQIFDSSRKLLSSEKKVKDEGYYVNGQGPQGRYWQEADISFITFNANHSFRHFDVNGKDGSYMFDPDLPATGTWAQIAYDEIKLSTLYGNQSIDTSWNCLYENGEVGLTLATFDTGRLGATHNYMLQTYVLHRKTK